MKTELLFQKYDEFNFIYYYLVRDYTKKIIFYIGIDPKNNRLLFFDKPEFDNPVGIISFDEKDHLIEIPGIKQRFSNQAAIEAYVAIKTNIFPQFLDYNAYKKLIPK